MDLQRALSEAGLIAEEAGHLDRGVRSRVLLPLVSDTVGAGRELLLADTARVSFG